MKAGIIAAGFGERLRAAGIDQPKPLIEIGGIPLIGRAIFAARAAGASEIACIINAETDLVADYLRKTDFSVEVKLIQRSTASSAESFLRLQPLLAGSSFLLLTVDSVFDPSCLEGVVEAGTSEGGHGALALTTHIDDEKPLYARVDESWWVTSLGHPATPSPYVTAGIYFFSPLVYELVNVTNTENLPAFRNLLQLLLSQGFRFRGHLVPTTIDVDRPEDIAAAQEFVRTLSGGLR